MKLIDAHTHLNTEPLVGERRSYMQRFVDAGGVGLVNSWADEQYNLKWIEIAKVAETEFPACIVKATVGRHPLECVENVVTAENIPEKMQRLKKLYSDNKQYVVAIGETWIDLHYPNGLETLDIQKKLFIAHCEFARETWLPLVIHSRDAFQETLEILKDYKDLIIYFHCRGYGPEEFKMMNSEFRNLYIGFCGNVTYKKTEELHETLKIVPLTQLLMETDAPYLTPQIIRGTDNHPANVKYIYEFVSELLHIDPKILSEQVLSNFRLIYKI